MDNFMNNCMDIVEYFVENFVDNYVDNSMENFVDNFINNFVNYSWFDFFDIKFILLLVNYRVSHIKVCILNWLLQIVMLDNKFLLLLWEVNY